jgi:SAM-dependent methyltransferase
VHQNLLLSTEVEARRLATGELGMTVCEDCNFVFNRAFDPTLLAYGDRYDNSQTFSPAFDGYVDELVDHLIVDKNVQGCSVVEVGCGKGEFLRKLIQRKDTGNTGHGFDPAYIGPDVDCDGRIQFHRQFYDAECSQIPADVVVSRHVIEHVPEPRKLLISIREALRDSPDARVFLETPCVEWILRNQVAWDFFYEHCSLFTAESLSRAASESGFDVTSVRHVFGGQYLWLEATPIASEALDAASPAAEPGLKVAELTRMASDFGETELRRNSAWVDRIQSDSWSGGLALWGAGAKGVTFANLVDPRRQFINCLVDVNPNKQGHFLPGTGHPIVSPESLKERGIRTIVVLNPNYCDEIRAQLLKINLPVTVIDLMNKGLKSA